MTFRTPFYYTDSGNFQEYSVNTLNDIYASVKRIFLTNPSVTLSVVPTGGNLGSISETQVIASPARSNSRNFGNNTGTLGNISTLTTYYDRINQTVNAPGTPYTGAAFKSGAYPTNQPLFLNDSGHFEPFNDSDFLDTFVKPAVLQATNPAVDPLYLIHDSAAGYTDYSLVSSTPVYSDNNADIAAYGSGALPETNPTPISITNYYLYRKNQNLISNVWSNVPYRDSNYSGPVVGTGFQLDVKKYNNTYVPIIGAAGQNYTYSDNFIVLGTDLGGETPQHDLAVYVDSIGPTGDVRNIRFNTLYPNRANDYFVPVTHTDSGDFQTMKRSIFEQMLNGGANYLAADSNLGFKIEFDWNTGAQVGTAMVDTRLLSPTQTRRDYQTGDTYYSQRVPTGGTQTVITTHYLGVRVV